MSHATKLGRSLLLATCWMALGVGCSSPTPDPEPETAAPVQPASGPVDRSALRRTKPAGDGPSAVQPEPAPGRTSGVEALRLQLLAMAGNDQEIRSRIFSKPMAQITPQDRQQLDALDKANAARFREILDSRGWPGKSLVGEEAADAAFLILQHADPELQKKSLPLLEQAYRAGDATGQQLALLTDRVRVGQGKPQLYGTQVLFSSDGQMTIQPIEDEARLDQRRAELGLPPHAEYLKNLEQAHKISR